MTASELKYLLTISDNTRNEGVKQSEIASALNLSRVSVLRAADNLARKKWIDKSENGRLILTTAGQDRASRYKCCARYLEDLFVETLGVRAASAKLDAQAALGALSESTVEKLYQYLNQKEDSLCRS